MAQVGGDALCLGAQRGGIWRPLGFASNPLSKWERNRRKAEIEDVRRGKPQVRTQQVASSQAVSRPQQAFDLHGSSQVWLVSELPSESSAQSQCFQLFSLQSSSSRLDRVFEAVH